jgi:hypothetical protein
MATSKEIEAGAKAIAEDLRLPGRWREKAGKSDDKSLEWFDMVEARGLTWADMSRLLFAAGAKGRNGRPFSVGTLYSMVWRKREDAKRIGGAIASSSKSATRNSWLVAGTAAAKRPIGPRSNTKRECLTIAHSRHRYRNSGHGWAPMRVKRDADSQPKAFNPPA